MGLGWRIKYRHVQRNPYGRGEEEGVDYYQHEKGVKGYFPLSETMTMNAMRRMI
jgi:hypothetical protein